MGIEQADSPDSPQIHHQIQSIYKKFETAVIQTTSITSDEILIWTGQVDQINFTYSTNELIIPFGIWRDQNDTLAICLPDGSVEISRYPGSNRHTYLTYIKTPQASITFETNRQTGIPLPNPLTLAKAVNLKTILDGLL